VPESHKAACRKANAVASPLIVVPQDENASDFEQVSEVLRDFYLRSLRVIERTLASSGMSAARARVLMTVAKLGPLRSTDLATMFSQAPRTVTEAIDGLEREKLVRRDPDPEDRRAKKISLTDDGAKMAEVADALFRSHVRRVFGVLDDDERGDIIRLINRLNERLVELGG
jgi:DNA-binding MarR family transcriptional regulator